MEKEKLFYDLHQTIKNLRHSEKNDYLDSNWISKLTAKISQMDDATLNIVLDIYTKLTSYTHYNIEFIILHANKLKDIFYEDGEFIENNLELLHGPYIESLKHSHIITLHCFNNNIPSDKVWNCVFRCICYNKVGKITIENLLLGNPVSNKDIINSLELLFNLNEVCSDFADTLYEKAGPLHKMQMDIYNGSIPYSNSSRKKSRDTYIEFLEKNINDEDTINRIIEYINTNEFDKKKTLNEICNLDVEYSEEIKSTCDPMILIIPDFKTLYKTSPKIAEKLSTLYSSKELEFKKFNNILSGFLKFDELQIELIENLL